MKLQELKTNIKNNEIQNFYIFTGTETAIMKVYIKQIAKVKNLNIIPSTDIISIYQNIQSQSLLATNNIYTVINDTDFIKAEKVWEKLKNEKVQGKNIVIMIYTETDKRSAFYKRNQDIMVEFEKLPADTLSKYIQEDLSLTPIFAKQLASICDCNYNQILMEQDKIKHLANAENIDTNTAYTKLIKNKLIAAVIKDKIFDLVNAICKREKEKSYILYNEYRQINQENLGLIALLYTNIRNMFSIFDDAPIVDLKKRTGLTDWEIKIAKEKGRNYTKEELKGILKLLHQVEKNIKTGKMINDIAMDYILVKVL